MSRYRVESLVSEDEEGRREWAVSAQYEDDTSVMPGRPAVGLTYREALVTYGWLSLRGIARLVEEP